MGVSENGLETRLYLDGVRIATGASPNINDSGSPLFIGNNPENTGRAWDGLIDDVGIFNTALNDSQAAAIYSLANDDRFNYTLSEINELFQLADCPAGTNLLIDNISWTSVTTDPADGNTFIQLNSSGGGVVTQNGPVINSFTAPHTSVPEGTPITFTWDIDSSVDLITISPGIGDVTGTTSFTLNPGPTVTTDYTLSATNESGTSSQVITITVTDQPVIEEFSVSPAVIDQGGSATITWQTFNATSASLDGSPVSLIGSTSVSPSSTTSYTLTVTNANGTSSETIIVPVSIPGEPIISEFVADNDLSLIHI